MYPSRNDAAAPRIELDGLSCSVCGSPCDPSATEAERYSRSWCRSCGTLEVFPFVAPSEAAALHSGNMFAIDPGEQQAWYCSNLDEHRFAHLASELAGLTGHTRVLDIGCHDGAFLKALGAEGFDAVGLDSTKDAVVHCRSSGLDAYQGAIGKELPDIGLFGAVTILQAFGYLGDTAAALKQIASLLKPGGILVIEEPNTNFHVRLARRRRMVGPGRTDRLHVYSPKSYRLLLRKAGFAVIRVSGTSRRARDSVVKRMASEFLATLHRLTGGLISASPTIVVYAQKLV